MLCENDLSDTLTAIFPDGEEVPCPIYMYTAKALRDKWAESIAGELFPDPTDVWDTYCDFLGSIVAASTTH